MSSATHRLPVLDTISLAWSKVKGSKKSFWAAIFLSLVILLIFSTITGLTHEYINKLLGNILSIIFQIIFNLLVMGVIYIGIKRAMELPISYRLMFRGIELNIALKLIGLYILKFIIYLLPVIIFLIPALVTNFTNPTILEQRPGPVNIEIFNTNFSRSGQVVALITSIIAIIVFLYLAIRMSLAQAFVLEAGIIIFTNR